MKDLFRKNWQIMCLGVGMAGLDFLALPQDLLEDFHLPPLSVDAYGAATLGFALAGIMGACGTAWKYGGSARQNEEYGGPW